MEVTMVSVVSTLIFKALEKSGEKLGEALIEKIGELRNLVREKFKSKGVEGILTQTEENPTEANKQMFQTVLEMQVSQDEAFANALRALVNKLKSNSQVSQIFLKDVDVSGSAEIGDVKQISKSGSSVNQEAATGLKIGGNLKISNVKQQS